MKIAMQFEDVSVKRSTEAQARRVLSDIHELIHGSPLSSYTVSEYAERWLAAKKVECREVTFAAYKGATESFLDSLGEKRGMSISYVTPAQVSSWRDASAAKATARTANNKLKIVRVMLQAAARDGLLPDGNPAARVVVLKTEESARRPLTLAEIKAIRAVASPSWSGMILAGLYTGQRLKDLAGLTWANVDLEKGEIRLATSKTRRRQFIPIAKPLREFFEDLPTSDNPKAPIFPDLYPYAVKAGGSAVLSAQFHELLGTAGLLTPRSAKKVSSGKGRDAARAKSEISFHSLRHTATSLLKKAGVSDAVAMDIIGHDTMAMSANYTHTDEASRRAAIDALPRPPAASPRPT